MEEKNRKKFSREKGEYKKNTYFGNDYLIYKITASYNCPPGSSYIIRE